MDDTYYTSKGGKIPVKWTAPEVSTLNSIVLWASIKSKLT